MIAETLQSFAKFRKGQLVEVKGTFIVSRITNITYNSLWPYSNDGNYRYELQAHPEIFFGESLLK